MPTLNGYGMCRAIKSDPRLRDVEEIYKAAVTALTLLDQMYPEV